MPRAKKDEQTLAQQTIAAGQHRTFKMVDKEQESPPAESAPQEPAPPAETPTPVKRQAKITVAAGAFRGALRDVIGAVHSRTEIPILSHVLVEASGSSLALTATDTDVWITRSLAIEPEEDALSFATALPAKALDKLLGELEAETQVQLELEEGETRATLKAGRSRFRLVRLPADDFPKAAPFTGFAAIDVPCAALADAIGSVRFAISTEETRYYLNGIYVHAEVGEEPAALLFAATDGNRLARGRLPVADLGAFPALIWMRSSVLLLEKLLAGAAKTGTDGDPAMVLVESDGDQAGARLRFMLPAAEGGETLVVAKSIDGTFPAYDRVIPTAFEGSATCDKDAFAAAVRRVAAIASEKTRAVKVTFAADKMTLDVSCPELGEASAELPCMGPETEAVIGFNADFLVTALAQAPAQDVTLSYGDYAAPTLLMGFGADTATTRLLQVLMPMRV